MKQLTMQQLEMVNGGGGSVTPGSRLSPLRLARKIATHSRGSGYASSAVAEVYRAVRTGGAKDSDKVLVGIGLLQSAGYKVNVIFGVPA